MDQHPIPQDVTGFQFKLIGSMTVKQFAYVAAGVISAVILYYFPLKISFAILIKTVLIPLFGGSGIVIAFVPIDGRPIDVMTTNFMKALFSPNQYIYQKTERKFSFSAISVVSQQTATQQSQRIANHPRQKAADKRAMQLQAILHNSAGRVKNKLDDRETAFLQALTAIPAAPAAPTQAMPVAQISLGGQINPVAQPFPQLHHLAPQAVQQTAHAQQLSPSPQLVQPAVKASLVLTKFSPLPPLQPVKNIRLPHTADVPNVIIGIVRDSRENILPNILVEVKDKDGNPIRAFKTNGLGHFASATPLPMGRYTIELDDPKKQHSFDLIQIIANNQIMQPIEIISHDAREALRKELFN